MISVHFQGKPFNIIVIHVYTPTPNAEAAEAEQFYEDLQDPLELKLKKKKMSFSLWAMGMQNKEVNSYLE